MGIGSSWHPPAEVINYWNWVIGNGFSPRQSMSTTRIELLHSAMELTESERLILATELMDTVSDDLSLWSLDDPDFAAELDRRANDGTPGIPWETVRAQLRADLES